MAATEGSLAGTRRKAALSTFRSPRQKCEVLRVYDKALLEQAIDDDAKSPDKSSKGSPGRILGKANAQDSQGRSRREVKMVGVRAKMEVKEEQRKGDQKELRERVERLKQMREQRFERLNDGIFHNDKFVMDAASVLRTKESEDFRRKSSLYNDWSATVYQPISDQLHNHLNPFNRMLRQSLRGTKSVDFDAEKNFQATCPLIKDPLKRNLHAAAEEDFFHRTARTVLERHPHSMSCPDLQRTNLTWSAQWSPAQSGSFDQGRRSSPSSADVTPKRSDKTMRRSKSDSTLFSPNLVQLPRGRNKPTLEPELWGQMKFQDTMYGHFAQICEEGPGFRCLLRAGNNVFIPDERDGISAAGKLHTRHGGFNDVGILKGMECSRGESSRYKDDLGSSHGAPTQDHYTYDTSTYATNIEFPLGKKVYPHMH